MSLSEIVASAGLSFYAEAALIIFFAAFVAVAVRLVRQTSQEDLLEQSVLPFDGSEEDLPNVTANDASESEAISHGQ